MQDWEQRISMLCRTAPCKPSRQKVTMRWPLWHGQILLAAPARSLLFGWLGCLGEGAEGGWHVVSRLNNTDNQFK